MDKDTVIRECFMGGPGLRGYAYQAALYCVECAHSIVEGMPGSVFSEIRDLEDCLFSDSDTLPQPLFFPESDRMEFCEGCGKYLYGREEEDNECGDLD